MRRAYVLGVNASHPFTSWIGKPEVAGTAEAIAGSLPKAAWPRLSVGGRANGERLYDWAYCELATSVSATTGPLSIGKALEGLHWYRSH